jgi:hypothetical protein
MTQLAKIHWLKATTSKVAVHAMKRVIIRGNRAHTTFASS